MNRTKFLGILSFIIFLDIFILMFFQNITNDIFKRNILNHVNISTKYISTLCFIASIIYCYISDKINRNTVIIFTISSICIIYCIVIFALWKNIIGLGLCMLVIHKSLDKLLLSNLKIRFFETIQIKYAQSFMELISNIGFFASLVALTFVYFLDSKFKLIIILLTINILLFFIAIIFFQYRNDLPIYSHQSEQNESNLFSKTNIQALLHSTFIYIFVIINSFLIYYFSNLVQKLYDLNNKVIIIYNILIIGGVRLIRSLINAYCVYKIPGTIIAKYSLYIYCFILLILPILSNYNVILTQICLIIFSPYYHSLDALILGSFKMQSRFTMNFIAVTSSAVLYGFMLFVANCFKINLLENIEIMRYCIVFLIMPLFYKSLSYYSSLNKFTRNYYLT